MTSREAVNWIINISADIGKREHKDLWHYEQALYEIRDMLQSEELAQSLPNACADVPDTNDGDMISRQTTYLALVEKGQTSRRYKLGETWELNGKEIREVLDALPSVQPEEVIPHRNFQKLSRFWCECGNYLGEKGSVKYCSECGKKVKW